MSLRGLIVLALLLAAALAAVFWRDRSPSPSKGEADGLGTLLGGDLDAVSAVEIGGGAPVCRIERLGEKGWRIVKPLSAEADPRQVEAFLRGLADARLLRVVQEKGRNLGGFGLEGSATVVRIERGKQGAARLVRLGRHSPVAPERYVSLGDGRVLLADLGGVSVERAPESFRERRLIPVEADAIRRIVIARPSGRLALAREGSSWSLAEPVRDLADFAAADGLARSVSTLSLARFLPAASSKTGAASVEGVEVAISIETGHGSLGAEIARADSRGERRARREGGVWSGVVADSDVSEMLRAPAEFREHRPLLFSSPDLRGVRIEGSGIRLGASRAREGTAWSVRGNSGPPLQADGTRIDEMVDGLRWIRAARVEDAPSHPFAPALTIELEGEGRPLGRLELDRVPPVAAANSEETLRARSTTRPGCLFEIPIAQLAALPRRPADLAAPAADRGNGERKP